MTPEPPFTLPFSLVLQRLCSPRLADELLAALEAVGKLREESSPSADPATVPADATALQAKGASGSTARAQLALARANLFLVEDLIFRIRRGEFHIRGRLAKPGSPSSAVVISLMRASDVVIGPGVDTITTADGTYTGVEGVLGPAPSAAGGEADAPRSLPLWDALVRWCDPIILCDIRRNEGYFHPTQLRGFDHPTLGAGGDSAVKLAGAEFQRRSEAFGYCWEALTRDLTRRIQQGEVYIQGVQTRPNLRTEYEPVPSTWATDFRFDFEAGVLTVAGYRYVAVTCSLDPPTSSEATPTAVTPGNRVTISSENVGDLDDETILAILEEHAKRVVEGPDARLISPQKVSLMPIIKRKMLHRAARGETRETLAAEAAELHEWIAAKVSSFQVPSPAAIANALRNDYRPLKPQSKAIKP